MDGQALVEGARWYVADAEGAGFVYRFAAGALAKAKYLVADMLLDGNVLATFSLTLHEGETGRVFQYAFGRLNQCSFRVRMALADMERLRFNTVGNWLEWQYALDVGLPASGIGHLKNQEDRAKAYRVYLEDAAADPYCVGAHWFTLYDESALGRSDGANCNIGFLDIRNRAYDALGRAAIASHQRMYQVADGRLQPFNERLEYLPKLLL